MGHNFDELRRAMVDSQVRTTDVTDLRLIEALLSVPREAFVPEQKKPFAYIDDDIEIGVSDSGMKRYIMEPSPFARLVQLAEVKASDLVLDIGCGTGYSSAVLSRLGSAVIALEADEELAGRATEILVDNGFDNVAVVTGAFAAGYPSEGPYDVIFVGGAVDEIPAALFEQLKEGGRLIAVEGHGLSGFATVYVKVDGVVSGRRAFNLSAKELPGFQKEFEFSL